MTPMRFSRTEMLLGEEAMTRLAASRVAIFGIGGVGSYAAEGLVRAGVGNFLLVDGDLICETNINRQIHATTATIGQKKTGAMKERMLAISPDAKIETADEFYVPKNAEKFFDYHPDYIVDAVDMVTAKLSLAVEAEARGIPIISSMGVGNKLDPTRLEVADIFETSICPLARIMRKELRKRGVKNLTVVYSKETPIEPTTRGCGGRCVCPAGSADLCSVRRKVPGSVSFVPSVAGMIIAGVVVREILGLYEK